MSLLPELAALREAARRAGDLAMAIQRKGFKTWSKPGGSPVTEADLAVNEQLKLELLTLRPDYGWLSEESPDDPARLAKTRCYVVDPIDGTSAYLRGRPHWTISLAVVENGRPILGVVHAPIQRETYTAALGQGAWMNDRPIRAADTTALENCRMLGDERLFLKANWTPPWPIMRVESRNSIAYRLALVGAGRFDALYSPTDKHEWDVAAGDLIAHEAGGVCVDRDGHRLAYNQPDPVTPGLICCAPALAPLILSRTQTNEPL